MGIFGSLVGGSSGVGVTIIIASVVFAVVAMSTMVALVATGIDSYLSEIQHRGIRLSIGGVAYVYMLVTYSEFDLGSGIMAFLVTAMVVVGSDYMKMQKTV